MKKSNYFTISIFIVTLLVILLPFMLKGQMKNFESLGLLGLFFINFFGSATIFLPAPAILSIPVFGSIYNPLIVAIFSSLGSSLGESIAFFFGYSSKEIVNFKKHKLLYFVFSNTFQKYGGFIIFLLSLVPNPFIDGIGIIAGISGYPAKKFILFVFLGRFIRDIVIASSPNLLK